MENLRGSKKRARHRSRTGTTIDFESESGTEGTESAGR